jgi:phosphotransferase system  glucose/maltose/N-acetylglucosamine-specific IIC component
MQSKFESFMEAFHNQWVGMLIGYNIVFWIFPLFDHLPQWLVALISTILFFISSFVRTYVIRRRNVKKLAKRINQK